MAKKFFVSVCIFVLFPVFLFCACVAPGISGSGTHGADCTCEQCKPGGDAHGADCTCEACNPGD
ncbi:MAG: hypothetical protein FWD58_09750, partial [Firmicutes bacterium]|nr:hypothetical protein [Bacillota bacterium]